ncbi:unnamed protein product [marine sediment metagenome]|uniref:Uncharacterized protein n=1 Tax=marine sediment metagenome TaxID=412755 RepID=X1LXQ1_9ZZZZ
MDDNEQFKLNTRRYLAWGIAGMATLVLAFIAAWGTVTSQIALVTLAGGGFLVELGTVVGFYFGKKASEE